MTLYTVLFVMPHVYFLCESISSVIYKSFDVNQPAANDIQYTISAIVYFM